MDNWNIYLEYQPTQRDFGTGQLVCNLEFISQIIKRLENLRIFNKFPSDCHYILLCFRGFLPPDPLLKMYLKTSLHSQLMYLFSVEVLVNMTAFSVAKPFSTSVFSWFWVGDIKWVERSWSKIEGQKRTFLTAVNKK